MRLAKLVIAGAVACCAMPSDAAWIMAKSMHFNVYSEDSEANLRRAVVRLEQFDMAVRKTYGFADDAGAHANPLTIYVVSAGAAVAKLCAGTDQKAAACRDIAGFYTGRVTGSVAFTPHLGDGRAKVITDLTGQQVLLHEYAHHLMLGNSEAAYPSWYVEGFAEFVSSAGFDKPGFVGLGKPAFYRVPQLLYGADLPITTLLSGLPSALKPELVGQFYGRAWLLTHYLAFSDSRRGQLKRYLEEVADGRGSLDAARSVFGDLKVLDKELTNYLMTGKLVSLLVPIDKDAAIPVEVRALSPGESAMMPVRLRSDRGVNDEAAKLVLADARRIAASFEKDVGVQDVLMEAEYDAGNDDAAEAVADRALAIDAGDRKAMIYKAMTQFRRLRKTKNFDRNAWIDGRAWLLKANAIDPNYAAPLYHFYRSFGMQGERPLPSAVAALKRALELAPQDGGLRFMVVQRYLLEKDYKTARAVLRPLAFIRTRRQKILRRS